MQGSDGVPPLPVAVLNTGMLSVRLTKAGGFDQSVRLLHNMMLFMHLLCFIRFGDLWARYLMVLEMLTEMVLLGGQGKRNFNVSCCYLLIKNILACNLLYV
jgi:hypothetical protein